MTVSADTFWRAFYASWKPQPQPLSVEIDWSEVLTMHGSIKDWRPDYSVGDLVYCRYWPRDYTGRVVKIEDRGAHMVTEVVFPSHRSTFVADSFMKVK